MSPGRDGAVPPAGRALPSGVVAVVGAGATNVKSTVALNLAVALAELGSAGSATVSLADLDGAARRALHLEGPAVATLPWSARTLPVWASLDGPEDARAGAGAIVVVDPPPRFGPQTESALADADLVVVPVDASPLAMRVLRDVVDRLAGGERRGRVRVVLARRLPRSIDRWGLVDRIDELVPGGLLASTLPMARPAADAPRAAVLYAPGTAAARAYAALAVEVVDALGGGSAVPGEGSVSTTP